MKLYDILMRHAGPKSQVEFVLTRVLADNEEQILAKLDEPGGKYAYGAWAERGEFNEERHDDEERGPNGDRLLKIYDDDYKVIGRETFMERMLRLRGEFNTPDDQDWDDAYYGIKHYGWSEGREVSAEDIAVLQRLGLVEDWRTGAAA